MRREDVQRRCGFKGYASIISLPLILLVLVISQQHWTGPIAVVDDSHNSNARKVYIDYGSNWCNTLRLYRDIGGDKGLEAGWEIYAFEASPIMAPYIEKFVKWLNGDAPKPPLLVPPAGSTAHMRRYAERYGCQNFSINKEYDKMYKCIQKKFGKALESLKPDMELMNSELVKARLAEADTPPSPNTTRYTFVPAAAGGKTGTMRITLNIIDQIRGGSKQASNLHGEVTVPLANVVAWMIEHFSEKDYVVVNMDIEGSEFSILGDLLGQGKGNLIDVFAFECHRPFDDVRGCWKLIGRLRTQTSMKIFIEDVDYLPARDFKKRQLYKGFDSMSTPDLYYPVDPS